ncbi:acyl-CoA dehydrogenase family protein [Streptosporangium sp. NPDC020072]|uniref:acyl-CoA dehydrogenase family protein n=1 Tax=unclassified Streptosporangium TaxID=2632669 RepID=UPI003331D368
MNALISTTGGYVNEQPKRLLNKTPATAETDHWLAKADALASVIDEHREQAEYERVTPAPVIDALRAAGVHRMWVSKDFGGGQVSLRTGSAVIQRLAAANPSVAWQMGVQGAIGRLSDYLPEQTARKLFAENDTLVVGGVNPSGRAVPVDGGFRLSGTWAFASGSAHADWLICAAVVTGEDGTPHMTDTGPETRMLFVPKSECRMLDTWHTIGLRGTGSEHFEIEETFVTEDFTVAVADMLRPPAARPSRAYAIGYYDFGPFTSASTAVGTAQGALEAFKSLATRKTPAAATNPLAGSHTVQEKLGRAEAQLRAARLALVDAAWHAETCGEDGGDALSALIRLTAATVAENATSVVDTAFRLAGTTAIYTSSPLERYFRDVHTAVKHITLSHTHFETVGQYLLGGPLMMRR